MVVGGLRRWFAKRLAARLSRLPVHVGIIPDGNRRWARSRGLPEWMGHVRGYTVLKRVLGFLWEVGVRYVSVYVLSLENCVRRPREELEKIYELIVRGAHELVNDPRVVGGELGFKAVGNLDLLPGYVVDELSRVEETARGRDRLLIACVCYGGRWEILETVRRAVEACKAGGCGFGGWEDFRRFSLLGFVPEPDLVIRSGGEMRISNFLLPHIAYTEFYFIRKPWPSVDELDIAIALHDYAQRVRRFGQ